MLYKYTTTTTTTTTTLKTYLFALVQFQWIAVRIFVEDIAYM